MALSHFRGHDIDDIFASFVHPFGTLSRSANRGPPLRALAVDFVEKPQHFEILADIPGVKKENISLDVEGDVLTFSVEQKESKEEHKDESGVQWHRVERSSAFQRRSLRLPENADMGKIGAKYEDGVLIVTVPKMEVQPPEGTKRIPIA